MNVKRDLYSTDAGSPFPYGISTQNGGINFALASKHAKEVTLCIFKRDTRQLITEIPLSIQNNKTGDVWHILVHHLGEGLAYAYRIAGKIGDPASLIDTAQYYLADPYSKDMATGIDWGKALKVPSNLKNSYLPLGEIALHNSFDWEGDKPPRTPLEKLIIYEMHVRGFTQDVSSRVQHPGTFIGVIEKIPYLIDLGINAVELLPIQEFNELEYNRTHPQAKSSLYNFWGYSTVNFFSPMNRYASTDAPGAAAREFKTMVKELHRHKIEVILDIVFNHTAEGDETGPVLSFKGIDNNIYYMLDKNGGYFNFSGCGNSFNCNHPVVVEFIISCLRYWVIEMHVDGFRFDLASALKRGTDGQPMSKAPLIEAITADPALANIKLIAEPWDAVGLYEVGSFYPSSKRWLEWNGKYRDGVRRFIKGVPGSSGEFAMRLCGSEDLYHTRNPCCSINFVTAHDGFSLSDLVSYNSKHNLANGEDNCDGSNDNESWNCGTEGFTANKKIVALRDRQMRNFHLALMVSQGVPMILMGDEYGHTKSGNNNTWCQDNQLNWFLWDRLTLSEGFNRYYRMLIHFRRNHTLLQRTTFLSNQDVDWHGIDPFKPDWSGSSRFVALTLKDRQNNNDLYIAFNMQDNAVTVHTPQAPYLKNWNWIVNTANDSPLDIYDEKQTHKMTDHSYKMLPHSAIMIKAY